LNKAVRHGTILNIALTAGALEIKGKRDGIWEKKLAVGVVTY